MAVAIFGKPETGGVVFAPPDDEQAEKRTRKVRVVGHVRIRIDVWEEFTTDEADEDEIIQAALERAGVDGYHGDWDTFCDIVELDGPTSRRHVLDELAAWKQGKPIPAERIAATPAPLLEASHV